MINDRACFTSGLEVETGSYYYRGQGHGRYLILQIDDCDPSSEDCRLSVGDVQAFCPQEGSYTPGTPGGPWTEDEVLIVKEKVRFMIDSHNHETLFHRNENFPPITNLVFGDVNLDNSRPNDTSMDYYRNMTFSRSSFRISPTPRKLIQLAFHDCLKNVNSAGEHFGGCDGCLNW